MNLIRIVAVTVGVLLLASSCGDSTSTDTAGQAVTTTASPTTTAAFPVPTTIAEASATTSPPTTTTETPDEGLVSNGDIYVALGSSFASGFLIPEQSTACGRSNRNYANLVAAEYRLELIDVSCAGASVSNVIDRPQGDFAPQIEAVTTDTKLITVTIGGNNIDYNLTGLQCIDPDTVCEAPEGLDDKLAGLRPSLVEMFERLREEAPAATIILVTYPREMPETNCPALSLTDEELSLLQDLGTQLEEAFVDVAEETGVLLVDPYVEPGDHTGCAPESERWVAGAVAVDSFNFHPTALGHQVMADLVIAALEG